MPAYSQESGEEEEPSCEVFTRVGTVGYVRLLVVQCVRYDVFPAPGGGAIPEVFNCLAHDLLLLFVQSVKGGLCVHLALVLELVENLLCVQLRVESFSELSDFSHRDWLPVREVSVDQWAQGMLDSHAIFCRFRAYLAVEFVHQVQH